MLSMRRFAEIFKQPLEFSKDSLTGHSEWKKKKRQIEEEEGRLIKEWTGMDFTSSARAAENRTGRRGVVANLSVVPQRLSKIMG